MCLIILRGRVAQPLGQVIEVVGDWHSLHGLHPQKCSLGSRPLGVWWALGADYVLFEALGLVESGRTI